MNTKVDLGQSSNGRGVCKGKGIYNGTLHFGHVVPTYFAQLIPQAKLNLSVSQFVRCGAMPSAVFGKVQLRNYVRAVSIPEIWSPFESMLSRQIYTQSTSSYVPKKLPSIQAYALGSILLRDSSFTLYKYSIGEVGSPTLITKSEATLSLIETINQKIASIYLDLPSFYMPLVYDNCTNSQTSEKLP